MRPALLFSGTSMVLAFSLSTSWFEPATERALTSPEGPQGRDDLTPQPVLPVDDLQPGGDWPACQGGCLVLPEPEVDLSVTEFRDLLEAFGEEPLSADSPALEALLFHGERSAELLSRLGAGGLDPERQSMLERELTRTHALLEVRVVDAEGVERVHMRPQRVRLGERRHLHADHLVNLQELEVSGTVRRVGLDHIWTRF